jgi:hypothetical protein
LISSAISNCAKTGSAQKAERTGVVGRLLQHLGAENVGGHQVGRELHATRVEPEHRAERFDQLGLGEARHADSRPWPPARMVANVSSTT